MSSHIWFIMRISDEVCPQVIVLKKGFLLILYVKLLATIFSYGYLALYAVERSR